MPLGDREGAIGAALADIGDPGPVRTRRVVGGGYISQAWLIVTDRGRYFIKSGPSRTFEAEARGLELLARADALPAPTALAAFDGDMHTPGYLLLPWVSPTRSPGDWGARLGRGMAKLHQVTAPSYGLDHDNFIGASVQHNGWQACWLTFFRDERLLRQAELAEHGGRWSSSRRRLLDRICTRLDELVGLPTAPALLHGDLWSGNILVSAEHGPMLIDPAVYYGDAEADIAMTYLFGGFPRTFYEGYGPLRPGWRTRQDIYNLYHLMNHLNLFGEGYGAQVDELLGRYQ